MISRTNIFLRDYSSGVSVTFFSPLLTALHKNKVHITLCKMVLEHTQPIIALLFSMSLKADW
jgi:hypothetical protein